MKSTNCVCYSIFINAHSFVKFTIFYDLVCIKKELIVQFKLQTVQCSDLVVDHLRYNVSGMNVNGDECPDDVADQLGQLPSHKLCQLVQVLTEEEGKMDKR